MTLAHGTTQIESPRLILRRVTPSDLAFYTRIHSLPQVARYLWPNGIPRTPQQTLVWLKSVLESYERLALGYLAVVRKADNALIGRCGIMELATESAAPAQRLRTGWFDDNLPPAGVSVIHECELGYTFDPAVWGQGYAAEAASCVRDHARDVLRLSYVISAIHPENVRSQRVASRWGARFEGRMEAHGMVWDRYVWPLLATGGTLRPPKPSSR
ncbi:MAG TPA: GNAT family N-acetyltransferase [Reyranella sp.]|nr:GNAT family N-acetyltransferase [Reyranella sp.]